MKSCNNITYSEFKRWTLLAILAVLQRSSRHTLDNSAPIKKARFVTSHIKAREEGLSRLSIFPLEQIRMELEYLLGGRRYVCL